MIRLCSALGSRVRSLARCSLLDVARNQEPANQEQATTRCAHTRGGYVFLVTVLIVGAVATTVVSSFLLLATTSMRTTLLFEQSAQALASAQTCIERALRELRLDGGYAGNVVSSLSSSSCRILPIAGEGNEDRSVCTEGRSGSAVRRLEVMISDILPSTSISSWREVPAFTLCPST